MTKDEYQDAVIQAHLLVRMAKEIPVKEALELISKADAVGWAIDPTLYRDKQKAMHEDREVLEAVAALRRVNVEPRP